jgi:GNAT superfamily N-acetyltransferase
MPLPDQMVVRPARPDDVAAIVTFSAAMARETEDRELDLARLHEGTLALLASPTRGFFMVAELPQPARRLIGQLMITYEWSDWRNGVFWWIQSVYVDPTWRQQGVFKQMHGTVVRQAKADPMVCGIRLYVEQNNRTARTIYGRIGLRPAGYDVYEDDFVLGRHGQH